MSLLWLSTIIMGVAFALLVWGGRAWLWRKYQDDVHYVRETALRFSPNPVHAERYVSGYYALMIGLLIFLIFATPSPLIGVALWLVLQLVPKLLIELAWRQRRAKIDGQLPGAIATMCNSIRAGLTLVQAIQRLAETAPDPIRTEFKIISAHYRFGADLESSILEAKQRLNLPNFNLFASAVLMNREMGGNVADTLQRISISLDKLHQMRQTVEAHTSEGRTNIKVLLVAPIIMLLMLSTMDYEGVIMLLTTPQGYGVLLVAAILTGTGVYFAAKITRSEI